MAVSGADSQAAARRLPAVLEESGPITMATIWHSFEAMGLLHLASASAELAGPKANLFTLGNTSAHKMRRLTDVEISKSQPDTSAFHGAMFDKAVRMSLDDASQQMLLKF